MMPTAALHRISARHHRMIAAIPETEA